VKSRRVPRMCHHQASGRAYVTDPASRRQIPLGRWGTPEAEAAYGRWVAEFLARPAGVPSPGRSAGLTVDQLGLAYLEHAEGYYRKRGKLTSEVYQIRSVLRVLTELYGPTRAADFGPTALKAVRERFVALGWARKHVNGQVHRLRRMFRWAVEHELVPATVMAGLDAVAPLKRGRTAARETPPVQPVPWKDVQATLPHLKPLWRVLVQVHYHGAMRAQDAVALRACDIDRSVNPWVYTPYTHKGEHHGAIRRIHLGPKCQALLAPILERVGPEDWLFPTVGMGRGKRRGLNHLTEHGYMVAVSKAARRAGVPHWTPLRIRHSALTEIRHKYGLDAAQVAGGHQHASTTEIYASADQELAARIARERG
jgi:integrase